MDWKRLHRWLGLIPGSILLVLGLTGALLAIDPVQQAWQAPAAADSLTVADMLEGVSRTISGVEEIRRLPSGVLVAYSFDGEQPRADRIDPASGDILGSYQPSVLPRWVKNLHRSLLLGDAGRWGAAIVAACMLLISASGLVLLLRHLGGWKQLPAQVRGSSLQRVHVLAGRMALAMLLLISVTALCMSAVTLGMVAIDSDAEPGVTSLPIGQPGMAGSQIPFLRDLAVADLRKLSFPDASDAEDTWKVVSRGGEAWIDRYSGRLLAWHDATPAQQFYDWVRMLHSGEGAWWPWALLLGLTAGSIPLFWLSGLLMWRQARRDLPRIGNNSPLAQADMLIFVASEGGSTWAFARALHEALARNGHRVHSAGLEHFQSGPQARQIFILAATYGNGQPPAHASRAIARIEEQRAGALPVTVLGFGDRQFPAFCAFAAAIEQALLRQGWSGLLPLERIHGQSAQQFMLWGEALARALGEPLTLDYRPRLPEMTTLRLTARQEYPGCDDRPSVILRFRWPRAGIRDRLLGRGLARFAAGDLVGIVPPGGAVPRHYSLASGSEDGFLEICVRRLPGGLCSTHLFGLAPGDTVQAFIRPNPGFALPDDSRPVILVGAGTGVAPLAGFIRRNDRRAPMHLYLGARDPARDFYFGPEIAHWRSEGRVASVQATFSRLPGGAHVQDALRHDAERVRDLVSRGALVRVCGSHAMARGVAAVLDGILASLRLSVQQLKIKGRYAEDVF